MWKDIKTYEDYYEISDSGEIRSKITGRILKPGLRGPKTKNCPGYKFVVLCRNPQDHQKHNVHRLVAEHFVENPENKPIVMHKDNNTLNCNANNLKWGTIQENTQDAHDDGLCTYRPKIYNVYNNETGDDIVCIGGRAVLDLIGSKSKSLTPVLDKVRNNRTISEGPYTGYKVRKLERGVTYE